MLWIQLAGQPLRDGIQLTQARLKALDLLLGHGGLLREVPGDGLLALHHLGAEPPSLVHASEAGHLYACLAHRSHRGEGADGEAHHEEGEENSDRRQESDQRTLTVHATNVGHHGARRQPGCRGARPLLSADGQQASPPPPRLLAPGAGRRHGRLRERLPARDAGLSPARRSRIGLAPADRLLLAR